LEALLITALLLSPCRQITAQVREKDREQDKKKRGGGSLIELVKLGDFTFLENAGAVIVRFWISVE
jgi:hypothetical protein